MDMNKLEADLHKACTDLGLRMDSSVLIKLNDGRSLTANALIYELGSRNGILIFDKCDSIDGLESAIVDSGYSYSVLDGVSPQEAYDLDSYVELFSDWGWSALDRGQPEWMS